MIKNKALVDVGVYYTSTAINQAVPFLILPIITIYLNPRDFGFINTFSAILLISTSVFNGLYVTINKHFYLKSDDYNQLLIGNLYLILVLGTVIITVIASILVIVGNLEVMPMPYLLLIPLISFFYVNLEVLKTVFKISKKTVAFAILTFSDVFVNVTLTLVLVIGLSWHWQGRVVAIISSTVLMGLFALIFMITKDKVRFSFDFEVVKDILNVAIPLIPSGFSVMLMRRSGVLFIDSSLGKVEAGLYGVAMNLATIILFLSVPLINVWTPYLYEKLSQYAGKSVLALLYHKLWLLGIGTCIMGLLFSLFSQPILKLMTTKAFHQAGKFIPWLAFGFCLWAMTALLTPFLVHFNRQKWIALIASGGAVVNLGLNHYLIGRYGSIGAAISFFAANFLCALIMFATVRHVGKLSFLPSFRLLLQEAKGVFK